MHAPATLIHPTHVPPTAAEGSGNRATAATSLNAHSSRSHALLSVRLADAQGRTSVLHLVDLAGVCVCVCMCVCGKVGAAGGGWRGACTGVCGRRQAPWRLCPASTAPSPPTTFTHTPSRPSRSSIPPLLTGLPCLPGPPQSPPTPLRLSLPKRAHLPFLTSPPPSLHPFLPPSPAPLCPLSPPLYPPPPLQAQSASPRARCPGSS
jgi:hypothetical protein